jgi:hypothetical protein
MHNCFLCLQPLPPPSSAAASSAADDRPSQPLTSMPAAATASGKKHELCYMTLFRVTDLFRKRSLLAVVLFGLALTRCVCVDVHAVFAVEGRRVGVCIRVPNLPCVLLLTAHFRVILSAPVCFQKSSKFDPGPFNLLAQHTKT